MRRLLVLGLGVAVCAAAWQAVGCGGDDTAAPAASPGDAGPDTTTLPDVGRPEDVYVPLEDAAHASCALNDGTDPVELCTQKLVLVSLHEAAFAPDAGVSTSWDSVTYTPSATHDPRDDAAYAAAIANYAIAAQTYGDTEVTATLQKDLAALVPLLKTEFASASSLGDDYSGELYRHLRDAAVGARYIDLNADANALDALADAYGRAIFAHFVQLGPGDGVLASTGTHDWSPGDVATGALALLDMAVRAASAGDAGADGGNPAGPSWVLVAKTALEHVYARGRDPSSGMYYRLLVPGTSADHDDLSPRAPAPQDELTADQAGTVALTLLRAQDLVLANPGILASLANSPLSTRANEAIASVNGAGAVLADGGAGEAGVDGGADAADAGDAAPIAPAPSLWDMDKSGYMTGWVPSTGALITDKPTRANALLYAALHRAHLVAFSPYASQLKPLRDVVGARSPVGVGLIAATPGQNAYFAQVSKDFTVLDGDGGKDYVSAAVTVACEGMNEQWVGVPH